MAIVRPYGGLSNDRLTALINRDNPERVLVENTDFTYSTPSDYSDTLGRNTQVTLTPCPGTPYTSSKTIHYTRLAISVLGLLPDGFIRPVVVDSFPFSIRDNINAINLALGLDLVADEVEDTVYETEQDVYTLHALGDVSLSWLDSTFDFTIYPPGSLIALDDIIVQSDLTGLIYLQPA